jgi:hypothetical protein
VVALLKWMSISTTLVIARRRQTRRGADCEWRGESPLADPLV